MIDPVTGWFEVAELKDRPTAAEAQRLLDSVWLARYPRPRQIGFDGGGEFKAEFAQFCRQEGIEQETVHPELKFTSMGVLNRAVQTFRVILAQLMATANSERW